LNRVFNKLSFQSENFCRQSVCALNVLAHAVDHENLRLEALSIKGLVQLCDAIGSSLYGIRCSFCWAKTAKHFL